MDDYGFPVNTLFQKKELSTAAKLMVVNNETLASDSHLW